MAGTYKITENTSDAVKFRGMVEFNGKPAQYYEVDLDVVGREIEELQKEQVDATDERSEAIDQEIAVKEDSIANISEYVLLKLQETADQDAIPKDVTNENELQAIA